MDLGGNIGTFSCFAGKHSKKVYSYEPEPDNFALLCRNISENKLTNVVPFQSGVSDKGDEENLYLCKTEYNKYQHTIKTGKKNWRPIKIDMKKFSEILTPDINAIKIDIEGAEMEILENGNFDNIDVLVFEWSFGYDNKTKRLIDVIKRLEKWFDVKGNLKCVYQKEEWNSYPRSRMVYCFKK